MKDFPVPNAASQFSPGDRRCTATNRAGTRCGRAAAPFQMVCDKHGAKAPLSLKAARERAQFLVEPALDQIYRAVRQAPPCEHCGRSDADRDPTAVRAAFGILDRAGLSPALALTVTHAPHIPHLQWVPKDRLELMAQWMKEAREAMERGDPQPADMVIDVAATGTDVPVATTDGD